RGRAHGLPIAWQWAYRPVGAGPLRVYPRDRGARALVGTRGQAADVELDSMRGRRVHGRRDLVPGLLRQDDGARRRSRAECVVAAVRGRTRLPGLPAESQTDSLDRPGCGRLRGTQDCAVRSVADEGL